jgi:quercetin dioxygenase-like cupin family protein
MKQNCEDFLSKILAGNVISMNEEKGVTDLLWNPHSSFKGVSLKHLVIGKDTDDRLSCHIVKIEPECILDTHSHNGKIEIHQVIAGSGKMYLDSREIEYYQGQICIIPDDTPHKVVADKDGMYILAIFSSSLL